MEIDSLTASQLRRCEEKTRYHEAHSRNICTCPVWSRCSLFWRHCAVLVRFNPQLSTIHTHTLIHITNHHSRANTGNVLVNSTVIGGLQSPPSGWAPAIVHGAIYLAATESSNKPLAFQQLAVSHAAHNSLIWVFHGTRNYAPTNAALKRVLSQIGIDADSTEGKAATEIGRKAARTVLLARADDRINDFVDYTFKSPAPGVYQNTSGGAPIPDTPQAPYIRLFGGVGDVTQFKTPPPPPTNSPQYEKDFLRVKVVGERNSSLRTEYETQTAYYWRESSISQWTRFANAVIGDELKGDVVESAKFFAQFYYAVANAGIASFYIKLSCLPSYFLPGFSLVEVIC